MSIGPFDIFLKLDGIDGESTAKGHEKEIVVLSYEQGIDAPMAAGGGGSGVGKPVFSGVRFRKSLDRASIPILLTCASGKHIKKATFTFRRTGAVADFYQVTLDEVFVRHIFQRAGTEAQYPLSFDTLATGADATGFLDEVTIVYARIQWEYHSLSGPSPAVVKGGWDVKANKKI